MTADPAELRKHMNPSIERVLTIQAELEIAEMAARKDVSE